MSETLFFDTYAIIEILRGNPNYIKYLEYNVALTKLNLFELYYKLCGMHNQDIADMEFKKYSKSVLDFDNDVIKDAAKLKLMFRKQDLSMVDCVGYIKARQMGIKFLTGDKQFEHLPDVEFVK